jgi:hypothetical protein
MGNTVVHHDPDTCADIGKNVVAVHLISPTTGLAVEPNTTTVSGSVTANAGTNLNTSELALETGGNLANIVTALGSISDSAWTTGNGTLDALMKAIAAAIVNGTGKLFAQGSPDSGSTAKLLKTDSSGDLVVNSNLQPGSALAGGLMTYIEMVSLGLIGSVKNLVATSQALVNNGGSQAAAIAFTDQNGNAYTTVTNGKTLYICMVSGTIDIGGTTSAPLDQAVTLTITDGSNTKLKRVITSTSSPFRCDPFISLASTTTLTVKVTPSNLATAVGNANVNLFGFEV